MSARRYQLSVAVMVIAAASFAILAVIDNPAWAILAVAAAAWPIRGVIHYGWGR